MARQIITFQVESQVFGVDIMAIREIRAWTPTTRLPHVPGYVAGVVNLRGTVLPVIDLAARLGWNATDPTARHVIIVTRVKDQFRGLIVDSVSDIVTFEDNQLQPPPATEADSVVPFLEGLVAIDERMVMVLDLPTLTGEIELRDAA
ncbi:MAG: chemotaxis protein CheW [Sphingomonas sp.]|jgi:purine-binding chemotaxis protein CheW|uniref:chemotaxis protein CheW n=1 Tax=Sphingomonas sp. TaxID=28214 RepID=UPI000A0B8E3F|nr:chemotaxis protein CheW [Sphingomonas sp.]MBX9881012.1 chemotaxis protein CheW [Sphingomonas sp.]OQW45288.1 MAG: chemotaxis protein CheW [Proteobacteria bacterium SG_bin6]